MKNTIESFKAELTGVYYAAVAQLDATTIKNKIENNNDPTSIVVSSTNKTLKYGEDYEIKLWIASKHIVHLHFCLN